MKRTNNFCRGSACLVALNPRGTRGTRTACAYPALIKGKHKALPLHRNHTPIQQRRISQNSQTITQPFDLNNNSVKQVPHLLFCWSDMLT